MVGRILACGLHTSTSGLPPTPATTVHASGDDPFVPDRGGRCFWVAGQDRWPARPEQAGNWPARPRDSRSPRSRFWPAHPPTGPRVEGRRRDDSSTPESNNVRVVASFFRVDPRILLSRP